MKAQLSTAPGNSSAAKFRCGSNAPQHNRKAPNSNSPMNLRSHLQPIAASLVALLCVLPIATQAADASKKPGKKSAEAEELFTSATVPHIQIEIPPEGIKELEKYSFQFGESEQQERAQVKAIVREGGKIYKDVAVQVKG